MFVGDISGGQEIVPVSFVNEINSEQLPKTWTYSSVNVPGPGSRAEDFETGFVGCTCVVLCSEESCECIVKGKMLLECGEFCPCSDACSNRVAQHGVRTPLQVFETRDKGFGVRPLEGVARGSFVCEYAGEVIGAEEAGIRARGQTAETGNYLLVLREHPFGKRVVVRDTVYDPRRIGNVGRFLNHSCHPNLRAVPVRAVNAVPRLCFYALRDVAPLEELSYDYAGGIRTLFVGNDQMNSDSNATTLCRCGASCCRRFLPFDPTLLNSEQNFI